MGRRCSSMMPSVRCCSTVRCGHSRVRRAASVGWLPLVRALTCMQGQESQQVVTVALFLVESLIACDLFGSWQYTHHSGPVPAPVKFAGGSLWPPSAWPFPQMSNITLPGTVCSRQARYSRYIDSPRCARPRLDASRTARQCALTLVCRPCFAANPLWGHLVSRCSAASIHFRGRLGTASRHLGMAKNFV